jgi:alkanesulfonate monooxygenase SsuD/methylene tetrahydromethanopterin reductase-like flavin-dependent oxidoreductase (luciferase family)
MVKFGVIYMPRSAEEAVAVSQAAEQAGFWGVGICDSPILYHELYATTALCLEGTSTIKVGPNVTNPVTRHWTVHASAFRAYEQRYPGRSYLGIASGDGAVHSINIPPSTPRALADAVECIRGAAPGAPIHVAAGGPRAARAVGPVADALILGTGLDTTAMANLRSSAASDTRNADLQPEPEIWALANLNVVETETQVGAAREETEPIAVAYARHALASTFEGKNVPEDMMPVLRERFSNYDFSQHSRVGNNVNRSLFHARRDIADYIIDRFSIIGTPQQCRSRLRDYLDSSGVDGIWFPMVVDDPVGAIWRSAEVLSEFAG